MTREIKFRYIYKHISTGNIETKKYYLNQLEQTLTTFLSPVFDFREYTLLNRSQYTGLKDSNGIEIYEGDLISIQDEGYPFSQTYTRIVNILDGSYVLESADGSDGEYLYNDSNVLEVIGNIHENPELLEEQS